MSQQIIEIELCGDGSIRINSRGLSGEASQITKELESLAASVGGMLEIERHEPGQHSHIHVKSGKMEIKG